MIFRHLAAMSKSVAVIGSSLAYALVHLKAWPVDGAAAWMELAGLTLLGIVLAFSCLATKQLYLAIGLHAALAYGARVNKLLMAMPEPSLAWLAGTSRLVNGVLAWIGLGVLGGLIVWQARVTERQGRQA
jgi:membrane protease YdiL (CAAX protease family)